MDKRWSNIQLVSWGLVGFFLFGVAYLYLHTYQNIIELPFFYQVSFCTILCLNIFMAVWSTRNQASPSTLSFIILLMSMSSMLIGFNSTLPIWIQKITRLTASSFTVLFLHFFIEHFSRKKYKEKENRFLILFQFSFFVLREISIESSNFVAADILFFGGILILFLFCISIFSKEKKQKNALWKTQEIKLLLYASVASVGPFLFGTLIPSLFIWGEFRNIWTLLFILILPITLGYLLSKNNLIVHHYWKMPLLASSGLYFFGISLFWIVLRVITDVTIIELFLVSHYVTAIGYTLNILFVLYTNYRKKKAYQEMNFYSEEKHTLTYYQLKNNLTNNLFQDYLLLFGKRLMLTSFNIYVPNSKEPVLSVGKSNFKYSIHEIEYMLHEESQLLLENRKINILKMSINETHNYIFILERNFLFDEKEVEEILKELSQFFSSVISHEELLELKYILEDRPYTALEKSVYLRDLELADLYHDRISRYLHDEVQQNILSLQYMSHNVMDIETLQKRIQEVVLETENSIKKKTVEWEGLPKYNDSLEEFLERLYKMLRYQYVQVIKKEIIVNSTLFAKEKTIIQSLLYRSMKELMINIFKHSKAKKFTLTLTNENHKWYLLVTDNGVGSEYTLNETNQFGLVSLYREISLVNGEMTISTKKDKGFVVRITIPAYVHGVKEQKK